MAKYKITLKRDEITSTSSNGETIVKVPESKKEVEIVCKWCTEAIVAATKGNYGFYPIAWECLEPDVKTPEELAEEAKNREIVEAWKKREAEKAKENTQSESEQIHEDEE